MGNNASQPKKSKSSRQSSSGIAIPPTTATISSSPHVRLHNLQTAVDVREMEFVRKTAATAAATVPSVSTAPQAIPTAQISISTSNKSTINSATVKPSGMTVVVDLTNESPGTVSNNSRQPSFSAPFLSSTQPPLSKTLVDLTVEAPPSSITCTTSSSKSTAGIINSAPVTNLRTSSAGVEKIAAASVNPGGVVTGGTGQKSKANTTSKKPAAVPAPVTVKPVAHLATASRTVNPTPLMAAVSGHVTSTTAAATTSTAVVTTIINAGAKTSRALREIQDFLKVKSGYCPEYADALEVSLRSHRETKLALLECDLSSLVFLSSSQSRNVAGGGKDAPASPARLLPTSLSSAYRRVVLPLLRPDSVVYLERLLDQIHSCGSSTAPAAVASQAESNDIYLAILGSRLELSSTLMHSSRKFIFYAAFVLRSFRASPAFARMFGAYLQPLLYSSAKPSSADMAAAVGDVAVTAAAGGEDDEINTGTKRKRRVNPGKIESAKGSKRRSTAPSILSIGGDSSLFPSSATASPHGQCDGQIKMAIDDDEEDDSLVVKNDTFTTSLALSVMQLSNEAANTRNVEAISSRISIENGSKVTVSPISYPRLRASWVVETPPFIPDIRAVLEWSGIAYTSLALTPPHLTLPDNEKENDKESSAAHAYSHAAKTSLCLQLLGFAESALGAAPPAVLTRAACEKTRPWDKNYPTTEREYDTDADYIHSVLQRSDGDNNKMDSLGLWNRVVAGLTSSCIPCVAISLAGGNITSPSMDTRDTNKMKTTGQRGRKPALNNSNSVSKFSALRDQYGGSSSGSSGAEGENVDSLAAATSLLLLSALSAHAAHQFEVEGRTRVEQDLSQRVSLLLSLSSRLLSLANCILRLNLAADAAAAEGFGTDRVTALSAVDAKKKPHRKKSASVDTATDCFDATNVGVDSGSAVVTLKQFLLSLQENVIGPIHSCYVHESGEVDFSEGVASTQPTNMRRKGHSGTAAAVASTSQLDTRSVAVLDGNKLHGLVRQALLHDDLNIAGSTILAEISKDLFDFPVASGVKTAISLRDQGSDLHHKFQISRAVGVAGLIFHAARRDVDTPHGKSTLVAELECVRFDVHRSVEFVDFLCSVYSTGQSVRGGVSNIFLGWSSFVDLWHAELSVLRLWKDGKY